VALKGYRTVGAPPPRSTTPCRWKAASYWAETMKAFARPAADRSRGALAARKGHAAPPRALPGASRKVSRAGRARLLDENSGANKRVSAAQLCCASEGTGEPSAASRSPSESTRERQRPVPRQINQIQHAIQAHTGCEWGLSVQRQLTIGVNIAGALQAERGARRSGPQFGTDAGGAVRRRVTSMPLLVSLGPNC